METNEEKAKKIVNNIFSLGLNTNRTFYDMAYNSALEMAAWKEQQMIDKVVKWINIHMLYNASESYKKEIIENFKKEMEEKQ